MPSPFDVRTCRFSRVNYRANTAAAAIPTPKTTYFLFFFWWRRPPRALGDGRPAVLFYLPRLVLLRYRIDFRRRTLSRVETFLLGTLLSRRRYRFQLGHTAVARCPLAASGPPLHRLPVNCRRLMTAPSADDEAGSIKRRRCPIISARPRHENSSSTVSPTQR